MADDFDFATVNAQVTEYLAKESGKDSAPAGEAPPATPPSSITPPATPPASAAAAPSATPAVNDGIEVEFEPGKVQKLTKDEIKAGMLRQADYTRKTQELATLRKQAEEAVAVSQKITEEREQLRQVLSDPRALMYLAQQQLAQQQGPQFDPEAPASMGAIAQLAQQNQAQLQQYLAQIEQGMGTAAEQAKQAAVDEVVGRIETAKHSETINAKLATIYETNPVLQSVPEIEDVIRYRVSQMQPATIDEALKAFEKVSGEVAAAMGEKFNNARKEQVIAKQKLVDGGIEPPGGAAVPANTPTSFRDSKTNVIDWKNLSAAAAAYVEGSRK
jgi:hypothetical protein